MRMLLTPLTILVLNYAYRLPILFTYLLSASLTVFDSINNHKDYENGKLNLNHFLCNVKGIQSSGNKKDKSLQRNQRKGRKLYGPHMSRQACLVHM